MKKIKDMKSHIKFDQKRYDQFVKRLGKHESWFYTLGDNQRTILFTDWVRYKDAHNRNIEKGLVSKDSKPSLNKFIWDSRNKFKYFVTKLVSRERMIDFILNKIEGEI